MYAFQLHADSKTLSTNAHAFFATINKMFSGSSQLPNTVKFKSLSTVQSTWGCVRRFIVLDSSRKLVGATKHLMDGNKKPICWLSFEF